jgi:hypothetical protein
LTGTINSVLGNLALTSLRLGDNNFDADVFPTFVYDMKPGGTVPEQLRVEWQYTRPLEISSSTG